MHTPHLPVGATLLASSDRCRNQAFRIENKIGLQFHLEVTPEMIADWCIQEENCGDIRELDGAPDPHHKAARLAMLSAEVFGAWFSSKNF